jgi:hypothetical protein
MAIPQSGITITSQTSLSVTMSSIVTEGFHCSFKESDNEPAIFSTPHRSDT